MTGYVRAAEIEYRPGEVILEVGSERGDGSSAYLAKLAGERNVPFISIDPDPETAQKALDVGATVIVTLAEDYLPHWDFGPPRFVWADGHDWPYSWHTPTDEHMQRCVERYRHWGAQVTREASAAAHLALVRALEVVAPPGCVVAFDDTWRCDLQWQGKGMTAVPWLAERGWVVESYSIGDEPMRSCTVVVKP